MVSLRDARGFPGTRGQQLLNHPVSHVLKSAAYTTGVRDYMIGVTTAGATVTITLSTASVRNGQTYVIIDEGGNAGTNNITIATEGSETIDGGGTATISANYGATRVVSDGSNWFSW